MKTSVAGVPVAPTKAQRISDIHRKLAALHAELADALAGDYVAPAAPAPPPAPPAKKRRRPVPPLVVAPLSPPPPEVRARVRAQLDRKGFRAP